MNPQFQFCAQPFQSWDAINDSWWVKQIFFFHNKHFYGYFPFSPCSFLYTFQQMPSPTPSEQTHFSNSPICSFDKGMKVKISILFSQFYNSIIKPSITIIPFLKKNKFSYKLILWQDQINFWVYGQNDKKRIWGQAQ